MEDHGSAGSLPDHLEFEKPSASERFRNIPKQMFRDARDAVKKTTNVGRRKRDREHRQSTNPIALAATRVLRESIATAKDVFHIVRPICIRSVVSRL